MKKLRNYLLTGLSVIGGFTAGAQCPSSVSISGINNTPANCPSSGSIRITSNAPAGTLSYILTDGPMGAAINTPQNDSNFIALPAGNYKVKAYCKVDPSISDSLQFIIANNYTYLDSIIAIPQTSCNNTGVIRVAGVTGGKAPLQYALNNGSGWSAFQSVDSFSGLAAGMYTVRVQDACGQYRDKEVEVLPSLPAPKITLGVINGDPCINNTYSFQVVAGYNPVTNTSVDLQPYFSGTNGLVINVYSTNSSCQKGTLLTSYNAATAGSVYFSAPKQSRYWVESVTSCGEVYGYCTADESGDIPDPFMEIVTSATGCGTVLSPATMSITCSYCWLTRWADGVTVTVKNSLGANITGSPFVFYSQADFNNALQNLPHDSYTLKATDACGAILVNRTIQDVTLAGNPVATPISYYMDCITQVGTTNSAIRFEGYIPNLGNADSVKIISGPSNVGINGYTNNKATGDYTWANLIPGDYTMRIYTTCGDTLFPVTIQGSSVMQRFISIKASSFCTGNGKIEIDSTVYNGSGTVEYVLIRTADLARVDSNITGTFTNLPSGDYKVGMKITGYCSDDQTMFYEVYSNTATIVQGGNNPQIVKKIAVACEDATGTPTQIGTIYLNLAGPSPLKLEYVDSSAANPVWTVQSNAAATTEVISGLNASHVYYLRVSGCTGASIQPATFGQMTPVTVTNTVQPCIDNPYTLSVPEMPGATYVWKNPSGVTVSNNPDYQIINYNTSYDGTYHCNVSFSGCVNRDVAVTLNSQVCGIPLPLHITSFNAVNKDCRAELNWTATYQMTDKEFVVERSSNGRDFYPVTAINVKNLANASYDYTDVTGDLGSSSLYYRLKLTSIDGNVTYSAVKMLGSCSENGHVFSVVPNPVANGQGFNLYYNGVPFKGSCSILNTAGQIILRKTVDLPGGVPVFVPLRKVVPGIYIVILTDDNNQVTGREKIVIY